MISIRVLAWDGGSKAYISGVLSGTVVTGCGIGDLTLIILTDGHQLEEWDFEREEGAKERPGEKSVELLYVVIAAAVRAAVDGWREDLPVLLYFSRVH